MPVVYQDQAVQLIQGDVLAVLKTLPDNYVQSVVTSPPYWNQRDYKVAGQIGIEKTPEAYIAKLVEVFREVRRVLKPNGTCFINLGDSYWGSGKGLNGDGTHSSMNQPTDKQFTNKGSLKTKVGVYSDSSYQLKPKDLVGIPWRVAFALQAEGWWLRSAIIWAKPNGMPGNQEDRPTSSYEMVFLFSKSAHYWSDFDALKTSPRESSLVRIAQNVQAQAGSHRANGGTRTDRPMKAVGGKQRGHSRRHDGFNARWDKMTKAEQQSMPVMMRDVWFIAPVTCEEAHFAVMPEELASRCILAGAPIGGLVLDPFSGAATTLLVAKKLNRTAIGIELSEAYCAMSAKRLQLEPARLL